MSTTPSYETHIARMRDKREATDSDLSRYETKSRGVTVIKVGELRQDAFVLLPEDEHDRLDDMEKAKAAEDEVFCWRNDGLEPCVVPMPDRVDLRPQQTTVKDQEDRGTCVCFASLAGMEAWLNRQNPPLALDLSEQYANWLFMRRDGGRNWCNDGLRTTLAATFLSAEGVCPEGDCAYEDKATVETHCTGGPTPNARARAVYGIRDYALIDNLGQFGPSIRNTDYLEAILSCGSEVVLGTHVAWGNPEPDRPVPVRDVILDPYGNPVQSRGGHAMLIVGYDRDLQTPDPLPYFILKNSWGADHGDQGYYYLSYDYVRTYAKYGFVVREVRSDMPVPA